MEEVLSIFVTGDQIDLLREYSARIRFLYDVEVKTEIADFGKDFNNFLKLQIWIKSMIEKNSNVSQAKKYVQSICSVNRVERRCQYTQEIFHHLLRCRDRIERLSGAVLVFNTYEHEVLVWGQEFNVTNALFMLDQSAQLYVTQSQKPDGDCQNPVTRKSSILTETSNRRKLEAVDSSYDSDNENTAGGDTDHDDVSRTVSETLAAEYAEYVNIATDKLVTSICESENSDESSASDGQYTNRVEFALKLGYTEDQVQLALKKLGSNPEQNELLMELIRLGASCTNSKPAESQAAITPHSSELNESANNLSSANVEDNSDNSNLRHIVIDGSNVAMSHGNKETFSCRGIKICVDWFKQRGHKEITVFVPQWRKETSRQEQRIIDQDILFQLERERMIAFTPSRFVGGRRMICYDDRYILNLAAAVDGIVVSNDNYRDLINESQEYKKTVEERLLMFTFVSDMFMPPDDPLGRHGPSLDNFLKKQSKTSDTSHRICPYLKKCTYGNKCKYQHPERGNMPQKLVSEVLAEQGKYQIQERKSRSSKSSLRSTVSLPAMSSSDKKKENLVRNSSTKISSNGAAKKQNETIVEKASEITNFRKKVTHTSSSPQSFSAHLLLRKPDHNPHKKVQNTESFTGGFDAPAHSNFHRKLQREPSVNAAHDLHQKTMQSNQFSYCQGLRAPLSRNYSKNVDWGSDQSHQSIWNDNPEEGHQSVTRIASAPDTYQQRLNSSSRPRMAMRMRQTSTSDSQLNVFNEGTNNMLPQFSWLSPQPAIPNTAAVSQQSAWSSNASFSQSTYAASQGSVPVSNPEPKIMTNMNAVDPNLIYHLCSLFPAKHVHAVIQMYPHETNPQKLCATILRMFPSSNE